MAQVTLPPPGAPWTSLSKKQRYARHKAALFNERHSWDLHWQELSRFLNPRAGRFNNDDPNDGKPKHNSIYDSTGLRARRVLTAGLMSGHASPARPFHRLKVPDDKLMKRQSVRIWLDQVTRIQREIFAKSNTYFALQKIYRELSSFGTAANFMEEDFDGVIHHTPQTVGEYALARNPKNRIDTIYREFKMRVRDMVEMFGYDACSMTAQRLYDNGQYYAWVPVVHVVTPRSEREYGKRDARNMRWASCWFEESPANDEKFLRESGYSRFPCLTPRWDTSSGDTYGESPGMEVLGDVKQLMHEQFRKAEGIDYQVNPPLQVPSSYKENQSNRFPGGILWYDSVTGTGSAPIKSAWDVQLNLQYLLADIQDVRTRINQGFFVDLFLMIAQIDRSNVTAREIAEKQEEKLIMLGPVIENLDAEVLMPLVDYTFERMVETKILPPPPPEMQGMDLQVEFIGVLAQAQRAVGIGSVDRLLGTVAAIAQLKPEALDKLNPDAILDDYADMLGVNPEFILANEEVAIIRQQREKQAQAQASLASAGPMADAAKTMSEIDTQKPSALTNLMGYSQ